MTENQYDIFLYFKEYIDLFLKTVIPYLAEQTVSLLKSWSFIILLVFLCLKKPIIDLINKIYEIHFSKGKIFIQKQVEQEKSGLDTNLLTTNNGIPQTINTGNTELSPKLNKNKKGIHLPALPDDNVFKGVFNDQEKIIKTELTKTPFIKEEVLIRELASYQIALDYERIFKDMFKSQIDALEYINSNEQGVTKNDLLKFYDKAKQQYPVAYQDFSFENWFAFFDIHNFIEQKDNKLYPTEKSQAFTYYIIVQRRYNILYKGL